MPIFWGPANTHLIRGVRTLNTPGGGRRVSEKCQKSFTRCEYSPPVRGADNSVFIVTSLSPNSNYTALRSATNNEMLVLRSAAPRAWNSLTADLRTTAETGTFRKKLKTFLFCKFYSITYWTFIILYYVVLGLVGHCCKPRQSVIISIIKQAAENRTLKTICISSLRPSFPGYLPAMFVAVRSKRLAPVSAQIECTSIFLPVPRGPARRTERIRGPFTCTAGEPTDKHNKK